MKYIMLCGAITSFIIFAWDIENDRDFWTWMWLGQSIFYVILSYLYYKKDEKN